MHPDDTIVAISSPPGRAQRGIIRLSGPDALRIAGKLFASEAADPETITSNRLLRGRVLVGGHALPAHACIFRAPHSYTGGEVVEIHMIGSPVLMGMVVNASLAAGARRAEPGEFTARAYLAGRMDLSEVHGIAGLIAARSDQQLRAAEKLMHGSLSRTALFVREELADLLSLVEGAMDFADEPIEFITPAELRNRLGSVRSALEATMSAAFRTQRWDRLPHVVLAGLPNAGKSSLFNRLTGVDRAICAPIAGTTRDTIAAPITLGGIECLLIDTPGLMVEASGLDRRAVEQARSVLTDADLILEITDISMQSSANGEPMCALSADCPVLRVGNKSDLVSGGLSSSGLLAEASGFLGRTLGTARSEPCQIQVSALSGEGCEALKAMIAMKLQAREISAHDSAIALMSEHRDALESAIAALDRAVQLMSASEASLQNADLVAMELHSAADSLGILVGQDQTEDMLGRIFARFCVGK